MNSQKNKTADFQRLSILNEEIQTLADESSLATLDHKLVLRQELLEFIFSTYKDEFTEEDMAFLSGLKLNTKKLLTIMTRNKESKESEIITRKSSKKGAGIYNIISRHKWVAT